MAIAGLGDIAHKAYLPVLAAHRQVDIVGIWSRTPDTVRRVSETYRIAGACATLQELLETRPELVFVHSPTETHAELVAACLRSGVHVYVDKPLSYRLDESQRLAEEARRSGKLLAVGFNRRFAPLYREAKSWLEQTGAGRFDMAIAQKHRTRQQSMPAAQTLYDDMIHMVDLLLWFGADRYELASWIGRIDDEGRLEHASGSLTFGERSFALMSMNRRAGADLEKLELHGGGRSAEVVNLEEAVLRDRDGDVRLLRPGSWEPIGVRRGFAGLIEHVLDSLDEPDSCTVGAERVMETHRLVERLAEQLARR